MSIERSKVASADRWNVEALYPSWDAWEHDVKIWGREGKEEKWAELGKYKNTLGKSPEQLKIFLDSLFSFDRQLSKLFTYAHLKHDEDLAEETAKKAFIRTTSLLHEFKEETSWVEPEILELPSSFLSAEPLKPYVVYLEKIMRLKAHTLSAEQEALLALSGKALESSQRTFSAFNNADLKFPDIQDSQGNKKGLTHAKYQVYLRDPDRTLRANAFKAMHQSFLSYENTLCEMINGQMQTHLFETLARKYDTCLDAALFPLNIDTSVYRALLEAVHENLSVLHRYIALRKQLLKVDKLHMYDLYDPLISGVDTQIPYSEAEKLVVESLAPLGMEYQEALKRGLQQERWVDRFENLRKRSGAYSSGCYDSMPYILLNFQGTFRDVMTLAHEAGHSMHSFLANRSQPYVYAQYPLFVAEVASTFNEELLFRHMLSKTTDKKVRAFLLSQKIEDIRATFFRQAMFAEFELRLHEWAEKGVPLTPSLLKETYRELNRTYFGPDLIIDEEIDIEWARIPHFYYNFYVYQYATGISAANTLAERVLQGGESERKAYLSFLSAGGSRYPLDLLLIANLDMRKKEPIKALIARFGSLIQELQQEMKNEL